MQQAAVSSMATLSGQFRLAARLSRACRVLPFERPGERALKVSMQLRKDIRMQRNTLWTSP